MDKTIEKELVAKLVVLQMQYKSLYMLFAANPRLLINLERRILGLEFESTPNDDILIYWAKNTNIVRWIRTGKQFSQDGDINKSVQNLRKYFLLQHKDESEFPLSTETYFFENQTIQKESSAGKAIEELKEELSSPIYVPPSRLNTIASHPAIENYLRVLLVISEPLLHYAQNIDYSVEQSRNIAQRIPEELSIVEQLPHLRSEWRDLVNLVESQQAPIALFKLNPPTLLALETSISRKVNEGGFHIIHFTGHGMLEGILLEDEVGRGEIASTSDLVRIFGDQRSKLVILNTCDSKNPGNALIQAGVPAVIATNMPISDSEGALISKSLYSMLAGGQSIERSFKTAQLQIHKKFGPNSAEKIVLLGDGKQPLNLSTKQNSVPIIIRNEPPGNAPKKYIFVGRKKELVILGKMLGSNRTRLILITGIGGIGKSALASEAVRRFSWKFPGGIIWLNSGQKFKELHDAIINRFSLQSKRMTLANSEITEILKRNSCLIVIDDPDPKKEQDWGKLVEFLMSLDPYSGTKAIITTRSLIDDIGTIDGSATLPLSRGLNKKDSVMCLEFLAHQNSNKIFKNISAPNLEEFIQKIDGHPLTLEIFSSLNEQLGFEQASKIIGSLTGPAGEKIKRAISLPVDELSDNAKKVLMRLTLMPSNLSFRTINEICKEMDFEVDLCIEELVTTNFLQYTGEGYFLHPLITTILKTVEILSDDNDRMWNIDYYCNFVKQHSNNFSTIYQEYGNILASFKYAIQLKKLDFVINFAKFLVDFLQFKGNHSDSVFILREALIKTTLEPKTKMVLISSLGYAYLKKGEIKEARSNIKKSLEINIEKKECKEKAVALTHYGKFLYSTGEIEDAVKEYWKVLKLQEIIKDPIGRALTLIDIGHCYRLWGEYAQSIECLEKSRFILESHSEDRIPNVLFELSQWEYLKGDYSKANELLRHGLELGRKVGNTPTITHLLIGLGVLFRDQNDFANARLAFEESEQSAKSMEDLSLELEVLREIAHLFLVQEYYSDAKSYYRHSLELSQKLENPIVEAKILLGLADLNLRTNNINEVQNLLDRSIEILKERRIKIDLALALVVKGRLNYYQDKSDEAKKNWIDSIEHLKSIGSPFASEIENLANNKNKISKEDIIKFPLFPIPRQRYTVTKMQAQSTQKNSPYPNR